MTRPKLAKGSEVFGRAVPLVGLPLVGREPRGEFLHEPVAFTFCQHACRGNAGAALVGFDQRSHRWSIHVGACDGAGRLGEKRRCGEQRRCVQIKQSQIDGWWGEPVMIAVEYDKIGGQSQTGHGPLACASQRSDEPDFVDFRRTGVTHSMIDRPSTYPRYQPLAYGRGEQLRVLKSARGSTAGRIHHHDSHADRPRQSAPTDFVHPGHQSVALAEQSTLDSQGWGRGPDRSR